MRLSLRTPSGCTLLSVFTVTRSLLSQCPGQLPRANTCSLDRSCLEGCEGRSVRRHAGFCARTQTPTLLHYTSTLQQQPHQVSIALLSPCAFLPGPHVLSILSSCLRNCKSNRSCTDECLSTIGISHPKRTTGYCLLTFHVCREHGLCSNSKVLENWRSKLGCILQIKGRHETQSASQMKDTACAVR
jgi:hypothetical protein